MGAYNYALVPVDFPNHVIFGSREQLEEFIDDKKSTIDYCKQKLHSYVLMTEPKKFIPDEYDPVVYLNNEFNELWEMLDESMYWLAFAQRLLRFWDNFHDEKGNVIYNPILQDTDSCAYLCGDYIEFSHDGKKLGEIRVSGEQVSNIHKDLQKKVSEYLAPQIKEKEEQNKAYIEWCEKNGKDPNDKSNYWYWQDRDSL